MQNQYKRIISNYSNSVCFKYTYNLKIYAFNRPNSHFFSTSIEQFDPRSLEFIQDPYPILDKLRILGPIHWNSALQGWIVTSYDNVRTLLADTQNLTSDRLKPGLDYLEKNKSKSNEDRIMFQELRHTFQSWVVFNGLL